MLRMALVCGVGLVVGGSALGQSAEARCAALANVKLDGAVVTSAAVVPAGAPMAGVELKAAHLPEICRVQVSDKPSSDSVTLSEVWLPVAG